ncbi:MAG: NAD(P)/FAD-dependent oxidoreductase [Clostridiales bacterium]|nr:NAD(P)/FAD-dependent oxidoreductase [Clostridiales bacterium]
MDEQVDIVVIGGGPAGLSAAINGFIRGCRVFLLDAEGSMLVRAERIDNYLGMPGLNGREMMEGFREHALRLGVEIEKGRATNVLPMGEQWMVSFGSKVASAKALVLATGITREKSIEGEEAYLGKGLSYCATCDGMFYRGKDAVVYGTAGDAPEEANYLAEIGVRVVYISPGERPEGLQADIEWRRGSLSAIRGKEKVSAVTLKELPDQEIETEGVFILRETLAPQSMVSGLQMAEGYIAVDKNQRTSIPGLYACGDCTGPPLQIANAVGDGLKAGQEAAKYVDSLKRD